MRDDAGMGREAPARRWIYHFTHVDNIAAICASGRLSCDVVARTGLTRTEVGDPDIKDSRRQRKIPIGPGGRVGDYVPFYFAPRSPMMYRIACDHRDSVPGRYAGGDRPLVYVVTTVGAVVGAALGWVAADGNAATATTEFTDDLHALERMVDWSLMTAQRWNNTEDDKGIALQFKRAYPANFRAYRDACTRGDVQVGRVWTFDTGVLGPRRYILNFPTKGHWRDGSSIDDIAAGLESLVETVAERRITSIAIPALGCGNGGLSWDDVRPLIERASAGMDGVRVVVFPPAGAPPAAMMPNATPRPSLTANRALLLIAVERYLRRARLQEVRSGISELEIQKLAYFLQTLGAPLRLTFQRGTYGPYAAGLSHVLDLLESHYLTGVGDRSTPVTDFAPINLLPAGVEAAQRVLEQDPAGQRRVDALLDLVEGFETPYSLELLATVHYAAAQEPVTAEPMVITDRVVAWSLRKARLFTDKHVDLAVDRLRMHAALPA